MALTLHYHPLSSYCWKALIALHETGAPFEPKMVDLGDGDASAAFRALWPTGKIPLLQHDGRVVPETSIMIEYLDRLHPGAAPLIPADPDEALATRLWDRLFDNYVMTPMQQIVAQHLRPQGSRDEAAVEAAQAQLAMAYDMIDARMKGRVWAGAARFSLADCAAAPSLFYAATLRPFPEGRDALAAYFERLVERPSVRRVIEGARPWFGYYPLAEAIPARFRAS